MAVGIAGGGGRGGQEGHSCVNDSDNVWVLGEVVNFLGMHVQNANLVTTLANH